MRFILLLVLNIGCMLLCSSSLSAQTDTTQTATGAKSYIIVTKAGEIVRGQIISDDGEQIVLRTQSMGDVTIDRSQIKSITESDGTPIKTPKDWYENPNASRYVVGPSAIPQKKGTGYYQNMYLVLHGASYAITDHFSVSAGTEILSTIIDFDPPAVYCISPRISYQLRPKLYAGGGLLYTVLPGYRYSRLSNHSLLLSGFVTYGTRDNNLTFGMGWTAANMPIYSSGNTSRRTVVATEPSLMLSGMWRPARWLMLVSENWYHAPAYSYGGAFLDGNPYGDLYFSAGARLMSKRFSFDFGVMNDPSWWFIRFAFPYVGFTINFDTKRARSNGSR